MYIDVNNITVLSDEEVRKLNRLNNVSLFPEGLKAPTLSEKVSIVSRDETGGRSAIAKCKIMKGEIICLNDGTKINKPIKYSWQIDEDIHLIGPGALDHNCSKPNCIIDSNYSFLAARNIEPGEFLTFSYLTTEWDMSSPFDCLCGEDICFGQIRGYKHLNKDQKEIMRKIGLSNYIKSKEKKVCNPFHLTTC